MFHPDEVQQVITESDARYGATTAQFAEGLGIPEAWRQVMILAQSDLLVLTFLCTYLVNQPSRQPTASSAGWEEWEWGYATLSGEEPVILGLASLIRGRMTVQIKHRDKLLCEVEPVGLVEYRVLSVFNGPMPQQQMTRVEFILWAVGLVQLSLMEADLGIDVAQVVAEHGAN